MGVTLFSYRRGTSVLHKTPAILKLAILIFLCICVFWGGSCESLAQAISFPVVIRTAFCFVGAVLLFFLGGANWKSLKNLRFVFVIGFLVSLLKIFYIYEFDYNGSDTPLLFEIEVLPFMAINLDGLASGLTYTLRLFIAAFSAQTIYETTSSIEIKDALETVQNLVGKIFPPIKKLNPALAIALAINFIPQIFATWERVNLAGKARSGVKTVGRQPYVDIGRQSSIGRKRKPKQTPRISVKNYFFIFRAFFLCLLQQAEEKRCAILARSRIDA